MNRNGKILFSSLKGGVGKSTAACEIAYALASDGYKVVLFDLDFRSRSLDLMLGVSDQVVFTLDDYILGRCDAGSVLLDIPCPCSVPDKAFLKLCPACDERTFESAGDDMYTHIADALQSIAVSSGADYAICDTGADSRIPELVADGFAELAIVVSEQSRTSIRAAEATAAHLSEYSGIREVRLIINNFDIETARRGVRTGILEIIDSCSVRCIGIIPHDGTLEVAQDRGVLTGRRSPVTAASRNISRRLRGIETPIFHEMKKQRRRAIL